MAAGFSTKLVTGIAELLAAAGVGEWAPNTVRTGTPVPWITLSNMPETPDLQDAVYEVLHGRRRTLLGTAPNQIQIVQALRRNVGQLGPDALSRWEWSATYDLYVNRANANLTVDA
jgi:hypothetical protein